MAAYGWDNVAIGAKYQLYANEAHESILSIGVDWDVGGTGSNSVGAERFSTLRYTAPEGLKVSCSLTGATFDMEARSATSDRTRR